MHLLGSFLFPPYVVWTALSPSYPCFAAARIVAGLPSAWSQTLSPATVADIFPREVRGDAMSVFATAVVVASGVAPLFSGLIVTAHSRRNSFWFNLRFAGLQFVTILCFVLGTLWTETDAVDPSDSSALGARRKAGPSQHLEMAPAPRVAAGRVAVRRRCGEGG